MSLLESYTNMKLGNKIGMGFGLVGLLFAGVILMFWTTLSTTQDNYNEILNKNEKMKSIASEIGSLMLQSRRSEKDFLLRKDLKYKDRVSKLVNRISEKADEFHTIESEDGDAAGIKTAEDIKGYAHEYHKAFNLLVDAWGKKGLDHKSGLQGEFRKAAHEVGIMVDGYDTSVLKITLLQIRRAEKDFMLRGKSKYIDRANGLISEFKEQTEASSLSGEVKETLEKDIINYNQAFDAFVKEKNKKTVEEFREAAHSIEADLDSHYVINAKEDYLMLRRHEKDYLLRGDIKYEAKAEKVIDKLLKNIDASTLSEAQKNDVMDNLAIYIN